MAPNGHARLSPSASSCWLHCAGSINFIDALGDDEGQEGDAAAEGTILHSVMEDCLRQNVEAYEFIGETRREERAGFELLITEAHADMCQLGLDYIDSIPGKIFIENWVDLSRWMPGQGGTLDLAFLGKKEIVIWDNKFGYLPVSPVENTQLMLYALGFWDNVARHLTDVDRFRLIIWQPRAPGGGGEWVIELDDLLAFGKKVKKRAAATYDPDAPRTPGKKQCAYCPGAKTLRCEEYVDFNLHMVIDQFDEMDEDVAEDFPPRLSLQGITPERRTWLLEHRAMFNKFFDRLHAAAYADAEDGKHLDLMKLVDSREGNRRWTNAKQAEVRLKSALGEGAFIKKALSPTQAQQALKKAGKSAVYDKMLEHLVTRPPGKPQLVSASDSRPARKGKVEMVADQFADFDDDED